MALDDFARRMLGLPMEMFGGQSQSPASGSASPAAIAAPMLANDEDMKQAGMQRLGQIGMLLMAAGQRMTPTQRASILSQAPQYMDGMQRDAMTAAQARLMAVQQKQAQDEMSRTEQLRGRLGDANFLKSLNLTPEQAQALDVTGVRKLLENQAMMNTPDAVLDRQAKQAQIAIANKNLNSNPYSDTVARNQAEFDARLSQGQQLGLAGDDLQQFALNGKLPDNTKATKDQSDAQTFLRMMDEAEGNLGKLPQMAGAGRMDRALDAVPFGIGHGMTSPEYQQAEQAQRQFIQAWLRRTSGAAISPAEFEAEGRKFFPQPGDTPAVIEQKAAARKAAREGLLSGTTSAFQRGYSSTPTPTAEPKSQPSSAPPSIQEGMTATNPQTGEKIVFRGGKWVSMQ